MESGAGARMVKTVEIKDDGRQLIYYSFGEIPEAGPDTPQSDSDSASKKE